MLIGNYTAENTLKKVTISDINYTLSPSMGTPNLYFKNINNFATSNFDENNKIENSLEFETSSEDEIDYSTPTLYNNCANPITLCYVNSNIKENYTFLENEDIYLSNVNNCLHILETNPNKLSETYNYILNHYGLKYLNKTNIF